VLILAFVTTAAVAIAAKATTAAAKQYDYPQAVVSAESAESAAATAVMTVAAKSATAAKKYDNPKAVVASISRSTTHKYFLLVFF